MPGAQEINFQKIIRFRDLKEGLKKLRRKNKYNDLGFLDFDKRYLRNSDKKENKLKKFLDNYFDDKQGIKEKALLEFYESIKCYSLKPYNALAIEKGSSIPKKFRPLLVPEPEDRLIFDALLPIYFERLRPHLAKRNLLGLGLVKGQKISDVLNQIFNDYIEHGYHFVLTLDYSSFFSLIDRVTLIRKLQIDLCDDELLSTLGLIINNEIKNGDAVQEKTGVKILENGIPQGLSFSPLLACYYALDVDDVYINDARVIGFRYIDDIIIFAKTENVLKDVYYKIAAKSEELKMSLHPIGTKTMLINLNVKSIEYLGVEISIHGLKISDEKFDDLLRTIKDEIFHLSNLKNRDVSLIKKVYLNFIRGWLNHYEKISCNIPDLHKKIDDLFFEKFFKKKRVRNSFYNANPWIKLTGNANLRK